jgi:hypothetical protein
MLFIFCIFGLTFIPRTTLFVGVSSDEVYGEEVVVDPSQIQWTQTQGPPGGVMIQLIQNPQRLNELYVLTNNGLYQSQDKGDTWHYLEEARDTGVSSIASYEDHLFLCGNGLYLLDHARNRVKLLDGRWDTLFVCDDILFVAGASSPQQVTLLATNLTESTYVWEDLSPSEAELSSLIAPPVDVNFWWGVNVRHVMTRGSQVFANIVMEVEGSGEYSNGQLFFSPDFGKT